MAGETQTVLLNDNATIVCKVQGPRHLDITIMGVTWFWRHQMSATEVILFQFFGAHRKIVRPGASVPLSRLERADASLQLPGVQLWEAGEYRCEVVITPHKAVGRVRLEVMGECLGQGPVVAVVLRFEVELWANQSRNLERGLLSQTDVGLSPGLPWAIGQLWASS